VGHPPATLRLPAHRAALLVRSPLRGAQVALDGKVVGRVPFAQPIPVEPGRVHVVLRSRTGQVAQDVQIGAGELAQLTLSIDAAASRRAIARVALVALGAGLLITGGVLTWKADQQAQQVAAAAQLRERGSGLPLEPYALVQGDAASVREYAIAADTALGVGAAAALTGGLLFVPGLGAPERRARLAPIVTSTGVGVAF
jgi:hypothetical protein